MPSETSPPPSPSAITTRTTPTVSSISFDHAPTNTNDLMTNGVSREIDRILKLLTDKRTAIEREKKRLRRTTVVTERQIPTTASLQAQATLPTSLVSMPLLPTTLSPITRQLPPSFSPKTPTRSTITLDIHTPSRSPTSAF
ncbi:unnamed protein product [Didymodactylos carnosus]|uniref:Uncharacterized protein n=1 Tax=Didymodactylos carnosus TaxID=1234261 RepID=A0A816BPM5_9BILA|nr:unnamed protein product [Didymodactylos carnosus]CAF4493246.1 unnamed protein product [Didymodactylos carnosus]